jgi:hypothetical protein
MMKMVGHSDSFLYIEMFKYRTVRPAQFPMHIYIVLTFHLTKLDAGASSSSARSVSFPFETGETRLT